MKIVRDRFYYHNQYLSIDVHIVAGLVHYSQYFLFLDAHARNFLPNVIAFWMGPKSGARTRCIGIYGTADEIDKIMSARICRAHGASQVFVPDSADLDDYPRVRAALLARELELS